jgi:hypothetical protein
LSNQDKKAKWKGVCSEVDKRDKYTCRLWKILTEEEKNQTKSFLNYPFNSIDHAHVLKRSARPDLEYDVDNIICLMRIFHSRLDQLRNPITGKMIEKEDVKNWFIRIIGEEKYQLLENK